MKRIALLRGGKIVKVIRLTLLAAFALGGPLALRAGAADSVTLKGKDIEVTVTKGGCGLVDEVKYKGEVVSSTVAAGRAAAAGFEPEADQAAATKRLALAMKAVEADAPCKLSETTSARGHKLITLENGLVRAVVIPWFGGRIIRFESKFNNRNLLDDPYEDRPAEVKDPKDIAGLWGELSDKIFDVKVEKQTADELVVLLTSGEERDGPAGKTAMKVEKRLRLAKGSPALVVEQRSISEQGANSLTSHLFGRFVVGPTSSDDFLCGNSHGRVRHAALVGHDINCYTDPRSDHWSAITDSKDGSALVGVFDGPVIRLGTEVRPTYTALEFWTPEMNDLGPRKEVKTTVNLVPCFNLGKAAFADADLALGVTPEFDVLAPGAKVWRAAVLGVGFTKTGPKVTLKAGLVDRHGKTVKELPAATVSCPFLIAERQVVSWPVEDLAPGAYDVQLTFAADGKEVGRTVLKLAKLDAGPVFETFTPADEEAGKVFPVVGAVERAKVEVTGVSKVNETTARVEGKHVFAEGASPFTAEIRLNEEGDGFEIRHTLTANSGAGKDRVRAVGLHIPLLLGSDYHRIKTTVGGEKLNDSWRVDQTDEVVYTPLISDWYSRWPLWKFGGILQDTSTHYRVWKACDTDVAPMVPLEGSAAPGWVEAYNGKWSVRIEVPDMPKRAPSEILIDGYAGCATVWFYPPHVPPVSLKGSGDAAAPSLAERLGLQKGKPWTNVVKVRFHDGAHPIGFSRELTDEQFRKLLDALGEKVVTGNIRNLSLPGATYEECVRSILESDIPVASYVKRCASAGYVLKPACTKLRAAYSADIDETIANIVRALKENNP